MDTNMKLCELFEKKKFGEPVTVEDILFLKRFKKAKLLNALVNPEVGLAIPEGYTPPLLEVQLCYSVVCGGRLQESPTLKEMFAQIKRGLRAIEDVNGMLDISYSRGELA